MTLRTKKLTIGDRIETLEGQIEEEEEALEDVLDRVEGQMAEHDVDDPDDLPQDVNEELEAELSDHKTAVKVYENQIQKLLQCAVAWSAANENIVDKPPERTGGEERSVLELDEEELWQAYEDVNDDEFRIKELTYGQLQSVTDDMAEESFDVDVQTESIEGVPQQGFYKLEFIRQSLQSWPPYAPSTKDGRGNTVAQPGDYPDPVGEWLFDAVDAFNTTGEDELGNSSLQDALKRRR